MLSPSEFYVRVSLLVYFILDYDNLQLRKFVASAGAAACGSLSDECGFSLVHERLDAFTRVRRPGNGGQRLRFLLQLAFE